MTRHSTPPTVTARQKNAPAGFVAPRGLPPRPSTRKEDADFDLAWLDSDTLFAAESKSVPTPMSAAPPVNLRSLTRVRVIPGGDIGRVAPVSGRSMARGRAATARRMRQADQDGAWTRGELDAHPDAKVGLGHGLALEHSWR